MYVSLHSNRGEIDGSTKLREEISTVLYVNSEQKRAWLAVEPLLLLLVHTERTSPNRANTSVSMRVNLFSFKLHPKCTASTSSRHRRRRRRQQLPYTRVLPYVRDEQIAEGCMKMRVVVFN